MISNRADRRMFLHSCALASGFAGLQATAQTGSLGRRRFAIALHGGISRDFHLGPVSTLLAPKPRLLYPDLAVGERHDARLAAVAHNAAAWLSLVSLAGDT